MSEQSSSSSSSSTSSTFSQFTHQQIVTPTILILMTSFGTTDNAKWIPLCTVAFTFNECSFLFIFFPPPTWYGKCKLTGTLNQIKIVLYSIRSRAYTNVRFCSKKQVIKLYTTLEQFSWLFYWSLYNYLFTAK